MPQQSELQFIYLFIMIAINIGTVMMSSVHAERKFEKRMVRIETFLMQCCERLGVPTKDINS